MLLALILNLVVPIRVLAFLRIDTRLGSRIDTQFAFARLLPIRTIRKPQYAPISQYAPIRVQNVESANTHPQYALQYALCSLLQPACLPLLQALFRYYNRQSKGKVRPQYANHFWTPIRKRPCGQYARIDTHFMAY